MDRAKAKSKERKKTRARLSHASPTRPVVRAGPIRLIANNWAFRVISGRVSHVVPGRYRCIDFAQVLRTYYTPKFDSWTLLLINIYF